MTRWGRRIACRFRGHRPVRVIDRVEIEDADVTGIRGRILEEHRECLRCRALL